MEQRQLTYLEGKQSVGDRAAQVGRLLRNTQKVPSDCFHFQHRREGVFGEMAEGKMWGLRKEIKSWEIIL